MSDKFNYSLELNKFLKYSVLGTPLLAIMVVIITLIDENINTQLYVVLFVLLSFGLWNWINF